MQPLVFVIVITFNGRGFLKPCFESIFRSSYSNYRVVLVDNASQDGSAEYTREAFPSVSILRNETNLGFAAGNNRAIQVALESGANYVVLLNDDTVVLDPRWLQEAVGLAEREPEVGMIGFDIRDAMPTDVEPAAGLPVTVRDVPRIDGCALFMRGDLLRRVGLLDEVYFAYAEEDDLEARAVRAGARLKKISAAIYHYGGGTSGKYPFRYSYLELRNAIRFSIKNRSVFRTLSRVVRLFDISCNPFPVFMNRGNVAHLRVRGRGNLAVNLCLFLAAILWNLIFLVPTLRARREDDRRILSRAFSE